MSSDIQPCAECGIKIGPGADRPTSSFDETLCVVCGLEQLRPHQS